jgi:hypothetical protein
VCRACCSTERFKLLMTSGKQKGKAEGRSIFRQPERLFARRSHAGGNGKWFSRLSLGMVTPPFGRCVSDAAFKSEKHVPCYRRKCARPLLQVETSTIGHFMVIARYTPSPTFSWQIKGSEDTTAARPCKLASCINHIGTINIQILMVYANVVLSSSLNICYLTFSLTTRLIKKI